MGSVTDEEFRKVAGGLRWSDRNLAAARAVLVDGRSPREVAEAHEVSEQQASVLKRRFLTKVMALRAMKVTPDDYLASRPAVAGSLALFRNALLELRRHGLSDEQLLDYLGQNDVKATVADLRAVLGHAATPRKRRRSNEDHVRRKSKGRNR